MTIILLLRSLTIINAQSSLNKSMLDYSNLTFEHQDQLPIKDFFNSHRLDMGLSKNDRMVMYKEFVDIIGRSHHRYHQYHNGIKVFGETYILHKKNNKVYQASGYYAPNINIENNTYLSDESIIHMAKIAFEKLNPIDLSLNHIANQEEVNEHDNLEVISMETVII